MSIILCALAGVILIPLSIILILLPFAAFGAIFGRVRFKEWSWENCISFGIPAFCITSIVAILALMGIAICSESGWCC